MWAHSAVLLAQRAFLVALYVCCLFMLALEFRRIWRNR